MYAQGYVKGLSPFEYRGKSPHFYKQRARETYKTFTTSSSVAPDYQYLVPSKWHKTGWKYTKLPEVAEVKATVPSEFTTTYSFFYKPFNLPPTPKAKKPNDSLEVVFSKQRRTSIRRSL